ncbi:MAG TPA: GntR family transcriptional regulator [Symbiobacteriaceae bacterium]
MSGIYNFADWRHSWEGIFLNDADKHLSTPLYYQIKTWLLEVIDSGAYRPGDRIPSERELTDQFGVSRMTARQALKELESQGYLYRVQGRGTFVATPKLEQPLIALTSFTEDMLRRGLVAGAQVISSREVLAGFHVGHALGIEQAAPVFRLERLRLADGQPMALEVAHLPVALCPGLTTVDFSQVSLYGILAERFAIRLRRASQSLEAVAASAYEAEVLHAREGVPLLLMERLARDEGGRPVEFVRSWYRGDRYRFTTELIRQEES